MSILALMGGVFWATHSDIILSIKRGRKPKRIIPNHFFKDSLGYTKGKGTRAHPYKGFTPERWQSYLSVKRGFFRRAALKPFIVKRRASSFNS